MYFRNLKFAHTFVFNVTFYQYSATINIFKKIMYLALNFFSFKTNLKQIIYLNTYPFFTVKSKHHSSNAKEENNHYKS